MTAQEILLMVLACAGALVALEAILALFYPIPHSIESNMYYEADPYTGYRLRPHGVGYYERGIPANANSHGHRDVEVPLDKPAGTFRILVIGDSFTVGANVRQEEAWPKVLERKLRSDYNERIQVINTAVGGWDAFQYAQYFEHYGYRFNPDLILIGFFVGNDAFDPCTNASQLDTAVLGRRVSRAAQARPLLTLKVFLHERSNVVRLLFRTTPASYTYLRNTPDDFTDVYLAIQKARLSNHRLHDPAQRAKARNSIDQIQRIEARAGTSVPVIVALLPDENQVNATLRNRIMDKAEAGLYDLNMPQSMLLGMFRESGIPTIDLLPAVRSDPRSLYMNDTHWVPEGHEVAASVIAKALTPFLPELKASR